MPNESRGSDGTALAGYASEKFGRSSTTANATGNGSSMTDIVDIASVLLQLLVTNVFVQMAVE